MTGRLSAYCLVSVLLLTENSASQTPQIKFNLVEGIGEVSLGKITAITQDSQGYMWFADQDKGCITRYDGYSMVSFRSDPANPNSPKSLGGNYPETLTADPTGIIWIGFYGMGLDRFDPETNTFTHYRHIPNDKTSLSNDSVTAIVKDHLGNVWVGSPGGLDLLDQRTGTFKHYRHTPGDPSSLSSNQVRSLYEDRQGTLWVGSGLPWALNNDGGLNRFDRKTGKFTQYLHDPQKQESIGNNKVRAMFEDSRGTFWVGTAGNGLHTMDREKGTFKRYHYDASNPDQLGGLPNKSPLDHITFITEDTAGAIWIGSFESGLNRYDPATNKVTHFGVDAAPGIKDESQFSDNSAWHAFNSREGVLWICTQESNLYRIDPFQKKFSFIKEAGSIIQSFYEDRSGKLWLGAMDGIYRTGNNKKIIKKYIPDAVVSYSNVATTDIKADENGQFWMVIGGKLFTFNPMTECLVAYKTSLLPNENLVPGFIFCMVEDKNDTLWIGGSTGLYLLDRKSGNHKKYNNNTFPGDNRNVRLVFCLLKDRQNDIWAGTLYEQGLLRINNTNGRLSQFLKGKTIISLFEDSGATLWAGTVNGLYRMPKNANDFSLFTIPGSPVGSAEIYGLIEDNNHNLWISSKSGIFKINPQRNKIIGFAANYNINGSELTKGIHKSPNGEILIGAMGGYYSFFPDQFRHNLVRPQIVLRDFKISDQLVIPGKGSPLKQSLNKTARIKLNHKQDIFSIGFAGIHFTNPAENKQLYKLEGYDRSWQSAGPEGTAYYFNVPPGNYVFRVKVSNSEDVWAERFIAIEITPAWWNRWLFRIPALLFFIAASYGLIRWRLHQKFRLQLERSEAEKQLSELKHRSTLLEMQALRAQMNPHFIFNSLNSINRFILQNNKEQASEYLTKFSKLVRMILQNSQASLITLESELEALKLYLDLEALRFEHHFSYKISVPGDLDIEVLKVPPLIIQPYAENSIWHGLMHKEEKGHLDIEIAQEGSDLYFKISDDGVGRKKAAELASKSTTRHKSMGLRITADRITMFDGSNDSPVVINDLVNPDGSSAGTEVIIKLPLLYE